MAKYLIIEPAEQARRPYLLPDLNSAIRDVNSWKIGYPGIRYRPIYIKIEDDEAERLVKKGIVKKLQNS